MELDPFRNIHITFRDIGSAVLDLVRDKISNPYPLEPQRGAEAMLDRQLDTQQQLFSYDDMGDWHRVPEVEGKDL